MKLETQSSLHLAEVRIGVSACLLGERVRYDGGHKKNDFLVETLGRFVTWVPVCPEVELGLGTPRPSLRLVELNGEVRLVEGLKPRPGEHDSGVDHTIAMRAWARRKVKWLEQMRLSGYVLKKDSPSCGMERVRLYDTDGRPSRKGRGMFAAALIEMYPNLPIEEEGRLKDARIRENFIERVFAYHDLIRLFEQRWTIRDLIVFHSAHKLQLLAHSYEAHRRLGRLVADAKKMARAELRQRYQDGFMAALSVPATPGRHTNALQHMTGYFTERLDPAARRELQQLIYQRLSDRERMRRTV